MNPSSRHVHTAVAAAVFCATGLASTGALAASNSLPNADERALIQQTYRADRASCLDGSTSQERGACLAEASAVRSEALRGVQALQPVTANRNAQPSEADLLANALARCDAVPSDVRTDCERRVNGEGLVLGSVAEGVIVRELPAPVALAQTEMPAADSTLVAQAIANAAADAPMQAQAEAPAAETAVAATEAAAESQMTASAAVVSAPAEQAEPAEAAEAMKAMEAAAPAASAQDNPDLGLAVGETLVPTAPAAAEMTEAVEPQAEPPVEAQAPAPATAVPNESDDAWPYPAWMIPQRFE